MNPIRQDFVIIQGLTNCFIGPICDFANCGRKISEQFEQKSSLKRQQDISGRFEALIVRAGEDSSKDCLVEAKKQWETLKIALEPDSPLRSVKEAAILLQDKMKVCAQKIFHPGQALTNSHPSCTHDELVAESVALEDSEDEEVDEIDEELQDQIDNRQDAMAARMPLTMIEAGCFFLSLIRGDWGKEVQQALQEGSPLLFAQEKFFSFFLYFLIQEKRPLAKVELFSSLSPQEAEEIQSAFTTEVKNIEDIILEKSSLSAKLQSLLNSIFAKTRLLNVEFLAFLNTFQQITTCEQGKQLKEIAKMESSAWEERDKLQEMVKGLVNPYAKLWALIDLASHHSLCQIETLHLIKDPFYYKLFLRYILSYDASEPSLRQTLAEVLDAPAHMRNECFKIWIQTAQKELFSQKEAQALLKALNNTATQNRFKSLFATSLLKLDCESALKLVLEIKNPTWLQKWFEKHLNQVATTFEGENFCNFFKEASPALQKTLLQKIPYLLHSMNKSVLLASWLSSLTKPQQEEAYLALLQDLFRSGKDEQVDYAFRVLHHCFLKEKPDFDFIQKLLESLKKSPIEATCVTMLLPDHAQAIKFLVPILEGGLFQEGDMSYSDFFKQGNEFIKACAKKYKTMPEDIFKQDFKQLLSDSLVELDAEPLTNIMIARLIPLRKNQEAFENGICSQKLSEGEKEDIVQQIDQLTDVGLRKYCKGIFKKL